ncbi:MAG: transcriptional repressor [Anaerolineae bacterium]|nr:transcriptional repressor [Anaerolineae bacterium]
MCCEDIFIAKLRARGFRLTPQRELVLSVMHDIEGHATAEEIYARVQEHTSSVDISTIYRTLELLQEFHLVAVIDLGDGQKRYELLSIHGPHHHLYCRSCGKLIRIEHDELQPLIEHLRQTYGFEAELEHLVIPGLCAECRRAQQESLEHKVA